MLIETVFGVSLSLDIFFFFKEFHDKRKLKVCSGQEVLLLRVVYINISDVIMAMFINVNN